jgi:hypothetical protein
MFKSAIFSSCRTWRYALGRFWDFDLKPTMFVGLNPSTADETEDDPTIRRCMGFAQDWGYGGLVMTNLFAYRATNPRDMKSAFDPIGPENDKYLADLSRESGIVIAAWGIHGTFLGRAKAVKESGVLGEYAVLGVTKDGSPRHPLYMKKSCTPLFNQDSHL